MYLLLGCEVPLQTKGILQFCIDSGIIVAYPVVFFLEA